MKMKLESLKSEAAKLQRNEPGSSACKEAQRAWQRACNEAEEEDRQAKRRAEYLAEQSHRSELVKRILAPASGKPLYRVEMVNA